MIPNMFFGKTKKMCQPTSQHLTGLITMVVPRPAQVHVDVYYGKGNPMSIGPTGSPMVFLVGNMVALCRC